MSFAVKVDEWGDPRPPYAQEPAMPVQDEKTDLVLVRVRYTETPYMEREVKHTETRLVRVAQGEDPYDKVAAYFEAKDVPYGVSYIVQSVEVMETIG